jgi:hypothetical protein
MKKAIVPLVLVLTLGTVTTVHASTTTLTASPSSSTVGQKVTFTAKFTPSCTGTVQSYYFTIDGKRYNGTYIRSGQNRTETYSTSTLAAGTHTITYQWSVTATCKGSASLSYTVAPLPSPTPAPSPSPTPSPSPSPSPSPVTLVADETPDTALVGYLGGALILIAVVSGIALAVLGRR